MKKLLAVMFAVLFAFSCMTIAFAANTEIVISGTEEKNFICDYCGIAFTSVEMLQNHLLETFPVRNHAAECAYCISVFTTETAYEEHVNGTPYIIGCKDIADRKIPCKYEDNGCKQTFPSKVEYYAHIDDCEYRSFCAMMKAGHVLEALKFAFNKVVDFVKSETFQNVAGKVVDVVKGIDFSSIIGKVKDIAGKIPFDTIVDTVKGLSK